MANEEHLAILRQDVPAWNGWRSVDRNVPPDLAGADLQEANLRQGWLVGAAVDAGRDRHRLEPRSPGRDAPRRCPAPVTSPRAI
jgi:hypothetical protein